MSQQPTREIVVRKESIVGGGITTFAVLVLLASCSSSSPGAKAGPSCSNGRQDGAELGIDCGGPCPTACVAESVVPTRNNGIKDNGESDIDCGGPNAAPCTDGKTCATNTDCESKYCVEQSKVCAAPRSDDNIKNGDETDVDCGGAKAPKCAIGKGCLSDRDCEAACNYANKCVDAPSCKPHLGGDTCGKGEVGQVGTSHESCCRSLPVTGYTAPGHPDKVVYLDKYEITTGRVRAFITAITEKYGGMPKIRDWIVANPPPIWDAAWNKFLPVDFDGEEITIAKELLGDRRPNAAPDATPVPETDEPRKTGVDFQFNGSLFVYLHGNNCSTHAPTGYGFPTFFYPANVLAKMGPEYIPRADGKDYAGGLVPASEHLEVKAMNCISNALLAAFCHWDGGQLATDEVLDFITNAPANLGNAAGCGSRCAPLNAVQQSGDSGTDTGIVYRFPFYPDEVTHEGAFRIATPGRVHTDVVRINAGDEPWMDLHGNVHEIVLDMNGANFTGNFGLKYRGIGYSSARAGGNNGPPAKFTFPEYKAAYSGGRCMRWK